MRRSEWRNGPLCFQLLEGTLQEVLQWPLLTCLEQHEGHELLSEHHSREYENHSRIWGLIHRAHLASFFWPILKSDAKTLVKICDKCQIHSEVIHKATEPLHAIIPSWSFMRCGIDIVGKLPKVAGQKEYDIMATNYFTKWVEAETLSRIRDMEVMSFLWRNYDGQRYTIHKCKVSRLV